MKRDTVINQHWKFHLGDMEYAYYRGFDDSGFELVTLPHDWSVHYPFDKAHSSGTGYLCGGIGWYRHSFTLPEDIQDKTILITFEGVYKNSRVWCNTNYLGMRPFGYATFTYDITPFVQPGENGLAVRVEHTDLADSRWFTGSGITRNVILSVLPKTHFVKDEVFTYTLDENTLQVDYRLSEEAPAFFQLQDGGELAATAQGSGLEGSVTLKVKNPKHWSPDSPHLYKLVCQAGEDELVIPVGIRTFQFNSDKGFTLNGESMKLKGVCVHHDGGALGAAVPRAVWQRRLEKLKQAGCNALRTSHNPPDPDLLDLCDEMGLLVMDEAFDEWEGCKNKWWQGHNVYPPKHFGYSDAFPDWHEKDLAMMVKRDRNHPSIIMWSIGNEIDYPNDPYVHPYFETMTGNNDANKPDAERLYDRNKPNAQRLATMARELTAIVKKHDISRPVTSALAFPELSNLTGYAQELDVVGYNYKEHLYEEDRKKYPNHIIYGSENGQTPKQWLAVRDHEDICGQFLWTGIDFLGECKGWPVRISQAGFMTMAGFEKPRYYHRQAMWTDALMAHIATSNQENSWDEQFLWNYEEKETVYVSVYTNGDEVELFLNGRSLCSNPAGDQYRAVFQVPFEKGELKAVAKRGDQRKEFALHTYDELSQIQLKAARDGEMVQVEILLVDAKGYPVVSKDIELSYALLGGGEILGIENGCPWDLTPYTSHKRATHRGKAIVYLRAKTASTLYVEAANGMISKVCI